ncbi:MAG: DUF3276 family protein [Spirochaetaceae bacterium]|nr:DUF3276 family protein [Spirochaetaceae bacterium]
MGVRGELFSTRVILQNRTYFFNVKENRAGDLYLNIVESKNREEGGFDRQSVILFAEDLQEFLKGFDESLRVLEKSVREQRRAARAERPSRAEKPARDEKPARAGKPARTADKPARGGRRTESAPDKPRKGRPPQGEKRMVVRKREH